MSTKCEYIRPLLAELVYGEIAPDVDEEIREHLRSCLSCRRHHMAFTAVREDLQAWQPAAEHVPHGMRFIAPGTHVTAPLWSSRWFQGLAAAAAFVFVALLIAATTNLQLHAGADGWTVSASLWSGGQAARLAAANKPEPEALTLQAHKVALEQIPGLDDYIDKHLAALRVVTMADLSDAGLNEAQMQQVAQHVSETLSAETATLDTRLRQYALELVVAARDNQAEQFNQIVSALVGELQARQDDQFAELKTQLVSLDWYMEQSLTQANDRIDSFFAAQIPAPVERERRPEK